MIVQRGSQVGFVGLSALCTYTGTLIKSRQAIKKTLFHEK